MKIDFEQFLMEKHAEDYIGTKDCMIDDFEKWVQDLEIDDFLRYGDLYAKVYYKSRVPEKKKYHKYLHNEYCECDDCNHIRRNNEHIDFWNACIADFHKERI